MINAIKYKEEISNVGYDFGILEKSNKIVGCGSCADEMKCQKCKFGYDEKGRSCDITRTEWLCQEYKEPIKLSNLEYFLLKHQQKMGYKYITRDETNDRLSFYKIIPRKAFRCWLSNNPQEHLYPIFEMYLTELFKFIKWEDEEPTLIQNILDNCEVVDNEKI
nr:MAG TPA: hypothetical protein [Caudoviricetes sp.]